MRKVFMVMLLIWAGGSAAMAQMQQGSWMVDGNLAFSKTRSSYSSQGSGGDSEKGDPTFSVSFNPSVGFFVKDNLVLGLSALVGNEWAKSRNDGADRFNTFSYGVGAFVRKYFPAGDKFSFFGEVSADASWENFGGTYGGRENRTVLEKGEFFNTEMAFGLQYLFSKRIGVHIQTPLMKYSVGNSTFEQNGYQRDESSFSFGLNHSFNLGGSFFF
ncbi:outer membrane beta-barrel protein [Algoriphagus terrigena]|uniref:outer membrane beta-barrel protein n=1 Tax=Algoriphagus terrigena TaxID=344884 RepID=UPI000426EA49|nr:outer membrane beta-barrel protein [Algoriphagus terrigena]